ncbi:MAG: VUT family protein [Nitrospirae bacterium]|nr:VUT family protein [Nitrospirota bacterium]
MGTEVIILIFEAMTVYFLVLWAHSLRHRFGPVHFYALIGGITAIMSWVTDAGLRVQVAGITFVVGSTVFYTSLLLGVFVVYVFDGPRATRIAISTILGVSIMVPLISVALHFQSSLIGHTSFESIPLPSLRINASSIVATLLDLVFLAMAWEYFGKPFLKMHLWLRAFLTLLGVMWLDVVLFATGAFAGDTSYLSIMQGTLTSRLVISIFALPFLYGYLNWQSTIKGLPIENRPVLAILKQVAEIEVELSRAKQEIERRKEAERERDNVIQELRKSLSEVKTLRGLLPICAGCKRIRDDKGYWNRIEEYIRDRSDAEFSHGICPDCERKTLEELDKLKNR